MPVALDKIACGNCGLITREDGTPITFDAGYTLYEHEIGREHEISRQGHYARWITSLVPSFRSLYEAGAGNGSLLESIRRLTKVETLRGCEPAPGAAAFARRAGLDVETGLLAPASGEPLDIAISVNVIEHTEDPVGFLRMLATHGRRVLVVCPNGQKPNNELLFADHRWSFAPEHIASLFARAGISCDEQVAAPPEIGNFFASLGTPDNAHPSPATPWRDWSGHAAYLATWSRLDEILASRAPMEPLYCFGAGEAAGLLRAYCSNVWKRVIACCMDEPDAPTFGDLPVISISNVPAGACILLALRPPMQRIVADRLDDRFRVIRWDDLIEA